MRRLYYATFEKGYDQIVLELIKKQDKSAKVRKVYADAVVFFADEKFNFSNNLFIDNYIVYDYSKKEGNGAINAEMKHLLEKKDFKIQLPSEVKKIRITYAKYSDKLLIDAALKNAFEIMLKRVTRKPIGFYETDAELVLMAKEDGDCLFMKKNTKICELGKLGGGYEISPRVAYVMNYLSNPVEKEVSLDPFAGSGYISYVRSLCFKKANVIANEKDSVKAEAIKKLARSLKEKIFSVMKYDFLSEIFPIRFIDKIVTIPPTDKKLLEEFFKKAYVLKVKRLVILTKSKDIYSLTRDMFEIKLEYVAGKDKIYVLDFKK